MADFKINITGDASGAVAAAGQTASALNKVADETERYQAALQKMTETQAMASGKSMGAEDVAIMQKSADLQSTIAERKKLVVAADSEIAAGVKVVSQEEVAAAEKSVQATGKAVSMKMQFKEAVKGLGYQFPQLAAVARLALNPITLAVSAIIGAFTLWKMRVDGLTQALAGMELPQVSERTVTQVNTVAKAYNDLATALKAVSDGYNSVSASSDRYLAKIGTETDQKKRLLAAERDLALAVLEKDKDKLKGGEYEKRKLQIENDYAAKSIAIEERAKRSELVAKRAREANLGFSAASKLKEAAGIHLASPEQDAETEKDLKAQADAAEARRKEARVWQGRIVDMESSTVDAAKWSVPYFIRYGIDRGGYGIESEAIERSQAPINKYKEFMRSKAGRDALRSRRGQLITEGTAEASESFRLSASLADDEAAAAAESGVSRRIGGMQSAGRRASAQGNLSAEVQRRDEEERKLAQEFQRLIASGGSLTQQMLQSLSKATSDIESAKEEMRKISQQGALRR